MPDFTTSQKKYMDDLFERIKTTFNGTITEIKNEFKEQIGELKKQIATEANKYESRILKLEEENKCLQNSIVLLERKLRKYNLVIYGIEKTEQNLTSRLIKIFRDLLEVDVTESDIKDIYRIRSKQSDNQPVIVEFNSYIKKLIILKNLKKLKGKAISISQDLCWEDREANKILVKHLKEARSKGLSASIKGNRLIVGKESYTAEDLESIGQLKDETEKKKSDSAPPTPNSETRKRVYETIELDPAQEQKQPKPSDNTNLKTGNTPGNRIVTRGRPNISQNN